MNKVLLFVFVFAASGAMGQKPVLKGWHLLDKNTDGYIGISLQKAYAFLQGRTPQTVIVGIVDSGIDTTHEDLKPLLWQNPKDLSYNGLDEDKNGFTDDVFGWNFMGSTTGENVEKESSEAARLFHVLSPKFENRKIDSSQLAQHEKEEYALWLQVSKAVEVSEEDRFLIKILQATQRTLSMYDTVLAERMGVKEFNAIDLEKFIAQDNQGKKAKMHYLRIYELLQLEPETTNAEFMQEMKEFIANKEDLIQLREKPATNYRRQITGDDETNWETRNFGNGDVMGKSAMHGTHVAGIIGAMRQNNKGMDGVADNVRLLPVRVVPLGDEHDKDVALGIRYAVDQGARVINMSFGKSVSPQKKWVDDAMRYAKAHNVLLVLAAGNDASNLDTTPGFPTPLLLDGTRATNVITVGASGDSSIKPGLLADFTNFGKNSVDVLAPGVKIYSTVPTGNNYAFQQGTSMAAPIVSGIAALLFSYFPNLSAEEVKAIIELSVDKSFSEQKHPKPGATSKEKITLGDACKTGGIVNAYQAVLLANEWMMKKKK